MTDPLPEIETWYDYDPETGLGNPSTPLSAARLNAWRDSVEVFGAAVVDRAETAADTAEAAAGATTDSNVATILGSSGSASRGQVSTIADGRAAVAVAAEVTRADLAYGRGELGYAQITTTTGAIASGAEADVPGLTVTVTVGAKPVLVEAVLEVAKTAAGAGYVIAYLYEGTTKLAQAADYRSEASIAMTLRAAVRLTPSAGTHTYKVRVISTSGGMSVNGGATPCYIRVTEG